MWIERSSSPSLAKDGLSVTQEIYLTYYIELSLLTGRLVSE